MDTDKFKSSVSTSAKLSENQTVIVRTTNQKFKATDSRPDQKPKSTTVASLTKKLSKKKWMLVLISFFVLIVLAAEYLLNQNIKPKQKTVPSPTPTSTTDETTNWKTYTNDDYQISLDFPKNLVPLESEATTDDSYDFRVVFENNNKNFLEEITLDITKGMNLASHVEHLKTRIVGHVSSEINEETDILVGGKNAIRLDYDLVNASEPYTFSSTSINNNGYNYELIAKSDLMDQILSTFEFLVSKEEAIEKVLSLPEVVDYYKLVPKAKAVFSSSNENSNVWHIHVYEDKDTHTATFNWYKVDKTTGEIEKIFDYTN
jgi:hypothetical protein